MAGKTQSERNRRYRAKLISDRDELAILKAINLKLEAEVKSSMAKIMDLMEDQTEVETLRKKLEEQAYTIEQQTETLDAIEAERRYQ
jgi:hypothetical protein